MTSSHMDTVLDQAVEKEFSGLLDLVERDPDLCPEILKSDRLTEAAERVMKRYGPRGVRALSRAYVQRVSAARHRNRSLRSQNAQLVAALRELKAKPVVGMVTSGIVDLPGGGAMSRAVLGIADQRGQQPYRLAAFDEDNPPPAVMEYASIEEIASLSPPYLGWFEVQTNLFIGPARLPENHPLGSAQFVNVVSVPELDGQPMVEIEVEDLNDHTKAVPASTELAAEVKRCLDDGDHVKLKVQFGVATGIFESAAGHREDWLEVISPDGPSLSELVLSPTIKAELQRDIRNFLKGRGVNVLMLGPPGVGKTECAKRFPVEVYRRAAKAGRPYAGIRLIRIGSSTVGSSLIHQTEKTMRRALKTAERLAIKGFVVVVLFDEIDAMLGETSGVEHDHTRAERLTAQDLLSDIPPGVAVLASANPGRNRHLPSAIKGRFRVRHYPRPTRHQLAKVAELYAGKHLDMLAALGLGAATFGDLLADNLYADDRLLANVHLHADKPLPVRVRDLHLCSPRLVERLVKLFADDVEDGVVHDLGGLFSLVDADLTAVDLNSRNVFEQTFLSKPRGAVIDDVEVLR